MRLINVIICWTSWMLSIYICMFDICSNVCTCRQHFARLVKATIAIVSLFVAAAAAATTTSTTWLLVIHLCMRVNNIAKRQCSRVQLIIMWFQLSWLIERSSILVYSTTIWWSLHHFPICIYMNAWMHRRVQWVKACFNFIHKFCIVMVYKYRYLSINVVLYVFPSLKLGQLVEFMLFQAAYFTGNLSTYIHVHSDSLRWVLYRFNVSAIWAIKKLFETEWMKCLDFFSFRTRICKPEHIQKEIAFSLFLKRFHIWCSLNVI